MPIQIALLRGINVGGRNMLSMSGLRDFFSALGFADTKTLLQSGNIVFQCKSAGSALESRLESETNKRFGISVDYVIRSATELQKTITRNPFPTEAANDPSHLLVMMLKKAAKARDVESLQAAIKGPEVLRADGKQLYLYYPEGIGRSKLTNTMIERIVGVRGTARNWNTLLKLASLACG